MSTTQQDGSTLAEKNQHFWNARAQDLYKTQWVQDLQQQISSYLRSNLDWIGINSNGTTLQAPDQGKMLDYACGHGIASQIFSSYFSTCLGLDVSEGMVETYNATARERGLTENQMHAVHGDLMAQNVDASLLGEKWSDFDLVVISMALHHLEDPFEGVKRLVNRLKEGGTLLVIDWAQNPKAKDGNAEQQGGHDHHQHGHQHQQNHGDGKGSHPAAHTMLHDHFSKEQMEKAFNNAGCDHFDFVLHPEQSVVAMGGKETKMQLFFARGRKTVH